MAPLLLRTCRVKHSECCRTETVKRVGVEYGFAMEYILPLNTVHACD